METGFDEDVRGCIDDCCKNIDSFDAAIDGGTTKEHKAHVEKFDNDAGMI